MYYYSNYFYEFRKDPVPYTGQHRWRLRNYYKTHIRIMQERKALSVAKEMGVVVRGNRNKSELPNPWMDYRRGDSWNTRSWKKLKKKKQWL